MACNRKVVCAHDVSVDGQAKRAQVKAWGEEEVKDQFMLGTSNRAGAGRVWDVDDWEKGWTTNKVINIFEWWQNYYLCMK